MTSESQSPEANSAKAAKAEPPAAAAAPRRTHKERVLVRSYPKIIVYYPTVLVALICGLVCLFFNGDDDTARAARETIGEIFMIVLFFNTIILAFEFPRLTAVAVFLLVLAIVLGLFLADRYFNLVQPLKNLHGLIHISANATFYLFFTGIYLFVYFIAWFITRFECWEITPNELLRHHGPFGDLERYPSPSLKLDKEIPDIFEFLMLGSGRLVFYPTGERRAIVLDNVMRVHSVERKIKHLLGAMEVRIDPDRDSTS